MTSLIITRVAVLSCGFTKAEPREGDNQGRML